MRKHLDMVARTSNGYKDKKGENSIPQMKNLSLKDGETTESFTKRMMDAVLEGINPQNKSLLKNFFNLPKESKDTEDKESEEELLNQTKEIKEYILSCIKKILSSYDCKGIVLLRNYMRKKFDIFISEKPPISKKLISLFRKRIEFVLPNENSILYFCFKILTDIFDSYRLKLTCKIESEIKNNEGFAPKTRNKLNDLLKLIKDYKNQNPNKIKDCIVNIISDKNFEKYEILLNYLKEFIYFMNYDDLYKETRKNFKTNFYKTLEKIISSSTQNPITEPNDSVNKDFRYMYEKGAYIKWSFYQAFTTIYKICRGVYKEFNLDKRKLRQVMRKININLKKKVVPELEKKLNRKVIIVKDCSNIEKILKENEDQNIIIIFVRQKSIDSCTKKIIKKYREAKSINDLRDLIGIKLVINNIDELSHANTLEIIDIFEKYGFDLKTSHDMLRVKKGEKINKDSIGTDDVLKIVAGFEDSKIKSCNIEFIFLSQSDVETHGEYKRNQDLHILKDMNLFITPKEYFNRVLIEMFIEKYYLKQANHNQFIGKSIQSLMLNDKLRRVLFKNKDGFSNSNKLLNNKVMPIDKYRLKEITSVYMIKEMDKFLISVIQNYDRLVKFIIENELQNEFLKYCEKEKISLQDVNLKLWIENYLNIQLDFNLFSGENIEQDKKKTERILKKIFDWLKKIVKICDSREDIKKVIKFMINNLVTRRKNIETPLDIKDKIISKAKKLIYYIKINKLILLKANKYNIIEVLNEIYNFDINILASNIIIDNDYKYNETMKYLEDKKELKEKGENKSSKDSSTSK